MFRNHPGKLKRETGYATFNKQSSRNALELYVLHAEYHVYLRP